MHVDFPSPGRGVNVSRKNEEREVLRTGRGANSGRTGMPSSSSRPSHVRLCNLGEVSGPFSLSSHVSSCGTPPLPSVLRATGLSAQGGRRLLVQGPYLIQPHALAVTRQRRPVRTDTAAVKQCSRKAGQMRSRRGRGRSRRVFAERACAQPDGGCSLRPAGPSRSVWLR